MSTRDRMGTASIAPGSIVTPSYFNISSTGSIEYNVDEEFTRRTEHSSTSFVVTIPTFYDTDFESGYVAADALKVSRNGTNYAHIDIKAGIAYIGGRRYKLINSITDYTLSGSSVATHYIRLKYTKSTQTFTYIAETSLTSDSKDVKYLTFASASWTGSQWNNDFTDLRSTNTQLPVPSTISGDAGSGWSLTVENTNVTTPNAIWSKGHVKIGDTGSLRNLDLYGDSTTGLIVHNAGTYNAKIVCDNTDRIKILSNLYVPTTTTLGSMTYTGTSVSGITSLTFGASPTVTTSSGDINWSSKNFTSVGTIGSGAVTSTSTVQGTALTSTVGTGTAPLTITSTTKVSNLNVDAVDGFHFTGAAGSVTADYTDLNNIDGFTGDATDLNTVKRIGRAKGDIIYASAADTLSWLTVGSDGKCLKVVSGAPSWQTDYTWTYAINGISQDVMTLGTILDFVPGTGINITDSGTRQMTLSMNLHDTPTNGATTTAITSNWAYDHAVGETVNLHTTVGTITSGTWHGTAIENGYVAQLNQNCLTTSNPSFQGVYVTSNTGGASSGKILMQRTTDIGLEIFKWIFPNGNYLEIDQSTADHYFKFVTDETSSYPVRFANRVYFSNGITTYADITLPTSDSINIGSQADHFNYIWANYIRYDIDYQSFDHLDDLAIIETIKPSDRKNPATGLAYADYSGLPPEIIGSGMIDAGHYSNLLAGGIKQLNHKVQELEEMIGFLMDELKEMKEKQ